MSNSSNVVDLPSLLSIRFAEERYLGIKYKKEEFAFYEVSICTNTEQKTAWKMFFRFSDIVGLHQRLEYHFKRANLFKTMQFPQIPPKKQWQRNKLDKRFICSRIRLLNIYINAMLKYIAKTNKVSQNLFFGFFGINDLYKYAANNDVKMLQNLYKFDENSLAKIDENKSNIFHFAVCTKSVLCTEWLLNTINKNEIIKLLKSKDQYHWTPIMLAKKYQKECEKNFSLLNDFWQQTIEQNEEKIDFNVNEMRLPIQYKQNLHDPKGKKRNLWIIINPFSGTANAKSIFDNVIKPFLDFNADRIKYSVLVTNAQFDAQKQCESLTEDHEFDGIVCLGGDGTIAECVNGLYHNEHLRDNIFKNRLCVTPIACGSGNALAKELGFDNICYALRRIYNGFETVMDGYLACQNGQKDTYSFVSTQWGSISSIDLDSESFRWMGSLRFTLKAVSEIAFSSHYKANVYFKPMNEAVFNDFDDQKAKKDNNEDKDWWKKLANLRLNDDDKNESENVEKGNKDLSSSSYPSNWICVGGEFALLCVTNLAWIAEETCMGGMDWSGAKSNSLRLVYNEDKGRVNYASVMLGLETGKHLEMENVKYFDVEEVVIEPLGKGPPMDVDGERKPLQPVYVKLLPSDFVVPC